MTSRIRSFIYPGILILVLLLALGSVYVFGASGWKSSVAKVDPAPSQAAVQPKPFVEVFESPVYVVLAGATEELEVEQWLEVDQGAKIRTGKTGRAQVVYPNKTVTRLDFDTEIVIESYQSAPQNVVLRLDKRRIWSRVSKLAGQESYQVKTSTIIATVRGTSFGVGILPDGRHKVITKEGSVSTACEDGDGLEAPVNDSKKLLLRCDGSDRFDALPIDGSDMDEWFEFNKKEDEELESKYPDVYERRVLGAATVVTASLPTPRPVGLVDCVGADGKTARVPREVCDRVQNFWKSQITPTPKQQESEGKSDDTQTKAFAPTQAPTPTTTPAPQETPTPTPTPVLDLFISSVEAFDNGNLGLELTVLGGGFDQSDIVELWLEARPVRRSQSQFISDTQLRARFDDLSCGAVYTVVVFSVNTKTVVGWDGTISDADRRQSCSNFIQP